MASECGKTNAGAVRRCVGGVALLLCAGGFALHGAPSWKLAASGSAADVALAEYFRAETEALSERCLSDIRTLEDWKARRAEYRAQLFDMLGLAPPPARADLKAVVTGKIGEEGFVVEKLHFQSMPGLYVTANLYRPKNVSTPLPTILYVCGHGPVISNGISYGNKVSYQHHGAWFARNGYVCLVIDSLQLGEIQGIHHGTYREGFWWWNSRGYTPAGVEAWNSIRALDYLSTRPEVDTNRFGVTGRSGGGAYSWWLAALDDRVKAAAPVAGITDLHNHVVDGVVEGHCDCMYPVNTYRWDFAQVAALVAPRPLLLVNTDDDDIFPLDGVNRLFTKVRRIYELHGAREKFGLALGPGGHKDTQDVQVPVFRWFNRHLKGEDPVIEMAAMKFFTPQQLRVFEELPSDENNTGIASRFVPAASEPPVPNSREDWSKLRDTWKAALKEKVFGGWPIESPPLDLQKVFDVEKEGIRFAAYDFTSQPHVALRLYVMHKAGLAKPDRVSMHLLGEASSQPIVCPSWHEWLTMMRSKFPQLLKDEWEAARDGPRDEVFDLDFESFTSDVRSSSLMRVGVAPRGIGLTAWSGNEKRRVQIRRRFMLLGQTVDGMRAWDIRRAIQAVRSLAEAPVSMHADGDLACDAVYATLFEPPLAQLDLSDFPETHQEGTDLLNVMRVLDLPHAVALAAENTPVRIYQFHKRPWTFATTLAGNLGWDPKRVERVDME